MGGEDAAFREEELTKIAPVIAWSFAFPVAECEPWLRRAGLENVHVRRREGAIDAALITIPMGQFFGGKSVPMVGVAGVATSAEARGTGAAVALLTRVLREQRARGGALSTLYPATVGLYRKLGYELAGARFLAKVPLVEITLRERELPVREMTAADASAVEACYRVKAANVGGFVDRGPYVWQRAREPRGVSARGFVVGEAGHVEGYAILHEKRDPNMDFSLHATDFVATTARAYRRLLTFAADHGTIGTTFEWSAAPNDPSLHLLPRASRDVSLYGTWMLRLLDVSKAMGARGWPPHARVELSLDVADDVLPENAGRWVLRVEGGRAEIAPGGDGAIRIDVRALASLYSSWSDPYVLASTGGLVASDEDKARLASVFAGPSPWMPDFF